MFRHVRENRYALVIWYVFLIFLVVPTFFELERVLPEHRADFLFLRLMTFVLALIVLPWLLLKPAKDFIFTVMSALTIFYCIYSSWYLPLFEFAFLQVALAFCFLNYQRRWLYPVTQLIGGGGFLMSHLWQAHLDWLVPSPNRMDYLIITMTSIVLTMAVHRYAYQERLDKNKMLHHYGVIGREATRLLHDVKGMLSSPILLAGGLLIKADRQMPDSYRAGLQQLHHDLENMKEVVYNLNRLVSQNEEKQKVNLLHIIKRSLTALGQRGEQFQIILPEDRELYVEAVKLESVFFNIFLNSIQAQELKKRVDPMIRLEWQGSRLVYQDNIGLVEGKSAHSTSLGQTLIEADLESMGLPFDFSLNASRFRFAVTFANQA